MRVRTFVTTGLLALGLAAQPGPAWATVGSDPSQLLGELKHFAGTYAPTGWAACQGATLAVSQHVGLSYMFGQAFGATLKAGRLDTFNLPTLPALAQPAPSTATVRPLVCVDGYYLQDGPPPYPDTTGQIRLMPAGRPLPDAWAPCRGQSLPGADVPALATLLRVADGGAVTLPNLPDLAEGRLTWVITLEGSTNLGGVVGEVRRWPAAAPVPDGWQPCNGATLPVNRNQAMFAIVGGGFGGDGRSTFALPTLPEEGGARWIICQTGQWPAQF